MKFELTWENLGNIEEGRPTLGPLTPILNYRLLQFSLRNIIENELGDGRGGEFLYKAGEMVGELIYDKFFSKIKDLSEFVKEVANFLYQNKICILRVEESKPEEGFFVFNASEDLDCSGVPEIGWPICQYDEGIIAGILSKFTGKKIVAKEVDCWATGERFCRIEAKPK